MKHLKLLNIRLGWTTNSSSSHSCVLFSTPKDAKQFNDLFDDYNYTNGNTYSIESSKIAYFASQMFCYLRDNIAYADSNYNYMDNLNPDILEFCKALTKYVFPSASHEIDMFSGETTIGNESALGPTLTASYLPHLVPNLNSSRFKRTEIKNLTDFLIKSGNIGVYIGDDEPNYSIDVENDRDVNVFPDECYATAGKAVYKDSLTSLYSSAINNEVYAYKIEEHGDDILFTLMTYNGNRIRYGTSDNITKSKSPDLVDISISDYCPYKCTFCYRNSTENGQHSSFEDVKKIIDSLSELRTFEVALGGGEPTTHPNFVEILEYCIQKHIKPNFTTYSTKWLQDPKTVETVADFCGGIGVSVDSVKSFSKVMKIRNAINALNINSNVNLAGRPRLGSSNILAQIVEGNFTLEELIEMHNTLENDIKQKKESRKEFSYSSSFFSVLFLGYKTTGRGTEPKNENSVKHIYDFLIFCKKLYSEKSYNERILNYKISVDTLMHQKIEEYCEQNNLPLPYWNGAFTTSAEGKFTAFIDATHKTFHASSYDKEDGYELNLEENLTKQILDFYKKF